MRLAHLILVHKYPEQVARLVRRLAYKDSDIYIHIDGKCKLSDYAELLTIPNVWFIVNRVKVNWATYKMIEATLNGFEEILATGINYSHFNLISGQDYPLTNNNTINKYLFKNKDKSFIDYRPIDNNWKSGQIRVSNYKFDNFNFWGRYKLETLVRLLLPKRKIPMNLKLYGNSGWYTLTPAAARYVIDFLKENIVVRRFFKLTWGADEIAIQTILLNSPLSKTIVHDNLRYIELGNNTHPRVFTKEDIDLLISSEKFFARKFDLAVDEKILDLLDNRTI